MTDLATKAPENGNEDDLARLVPAPLFLSGKHGAGRIAWVSLRDLGWAQRFRWFVTPNGYAFCNTGIPSGPGTVLERQTAYLHRLVMNAGPGERIDHIDGDKLNCRPANLRFATQAENNRNVGRRGHSRQPYKGVRRTVQGNWSARIRVEDREVYLGRFATAEAAARAYDAAARRLHGAFARTNFPEARP